MRLDGAGEEEDEWGEGEGGVDGEKRKDGS